MTKLPEYLQYNTLHNPKVLRDDPQMLLAIAGFRNRILLKQFQQCRFFLVSYAQNVGQGFVAIVL